MNILRKILFPFSLIYGLIVLVRNFLFDTQVIKSAQFQIPVICVGNLSVGGTGKTPMIEYLLTLLLPNHKTATLSRGYGRKSKGYRVLQENDHAGEVGDEPLQFKTKFPEAIVAVDEQRKRGISSLIATFNPEVILLDDAFQHRKVKAGLNILLTTYDKLYKNDFLLPTGDLREPVMGAQRASIVVVTKCSKNITLKERQRIKKKLQLKPSQKIFFSWIDYSRHVHSLSESFLINTWTDQKITLITGIANPSSLLKYLESLQIDYVHYNFPDHHIFTEQELKQFTSAEKILTTEKDFMRLKERIPQGNLYYLPIKMKFIENATEFDKLIDGYIHKAK
ncbi:MAG: tetraacyldisaccharide 4'-kinase [Gillisia sp.]